MTTGKFLIYGLFDPRNGELRYVGKSSSGLKRPKEHWKPSALGSGRNRWKISWLQQVLEAGSEPEVAVLESLENSDRLSEAEQWHIAYWRSLGCRLTNLTSGGEGTSGYVVSVETREKHRRNASGKKASRETREKMSSCRAGDGNRYETIRQVARQLGVDRSQIAKVLKGQYRQAGGYVFGYVE